MLDLLLAAAIATTPCAVENAQYVMRTAPGVTARFVDINSGTDWPNGLALGINLKATGHTYWFVPWSGGTDDIQHLAAIDGVTRVNGKPPMAGGVNEAFGDINYISTDNYYNVIDDIAKVQLRRTFCCRI